MTFVEKFLGTRVLITGGLGFIGSHLARRLCAAGATVTIMDSLVPEYGGNLHNIADIRDRLNVNISDVRDRHAMKHLVRGQDFLFNLAGQTSHLDSMLDPFTDLEINAASQLAILEACRHHNPRIRIVFASTRQVYGKPRYLPVDEDHPLAPVDVNGINKLSGEWYHLLYHQVYGLHVCVLRLTNTYGPCMRIKDARQTFLGIWIRLILEGKPFKIFGDGAQRRDFNHVDDVVDALLLAATHEQALGRLFNLGGAEILSLRELGELLVEVNRGGEMEIVPFPPERKAIDIGDYYGSYAKFQAATGWEPCRPMRDGLEQTLSYYHNHYSHYVDGGVLPRPAPPGGTAAPAAAPSYEHQSLGVS
ncbi:MAG TPA: NAD-dependent epimerase/dehydratase family protein [Opitutaceae bacterium]|nr:NAD-dependent epimerase/dehydratase family protein [Opitutaceae bacterium]